MVVSKSLLAVGGFFVVLALVISGVLFFVSRPKTTTTPISQTTQPSTSNSKYKVSKLPVDESTYFYILEGKFTQKLSNLGPLSRATFRIEGDPTNEIMVTFPAGPSSFSVGTKNAKGEMEWKNQPFSSVKSRILPEVTVQLRIQLSSTTSEHKQQIAMLDELIQASEIKPTYYAIQPDGIGFL